MYMGEVNVAQEELNSFLAVAEDLRVKGKYFSFCKFFLINQLLAGCFPSFQPYSPVFIAYYLVKRNNKLV
jgi:hypothetical protein